MHMLVRHQFLLVVIAAIVLFTNLGVPRLWDVDEPRNAGCAAEMFARADWIVPTFNAQLRTHKPVLLYWLMMSAYAVFGVSEFAARFWSAVLGVGTVLMTYHIGRRLFNAEAALWGGIALSTCLMFDVAARAATPDSVLIFFSTAALLVYVLGTFKPKPRESEEPVATEFRSVNQFLPGSWWVTALMYGLMGAAVLAKGPVGLVLPTAVIGMFLLIEWLPEAPEFDASGIASRSLLAFLRSLYRLPAWLRRSVWMMTKTIVRGLRPFDPLHFLRTCRAMRPITAIGVALTVALPWYAWVHVRTNGAWTRGFFLEHHLKRATEAMEGHDGSVLFYPIATMFGFFPWSLLFVPMFIGLIVRIRRRESWSPAYVFCACWVGVYVGVFSLARTKLPSYVTPMYPALALIAGAFVYRWTRGRAIARRAWMRLAMGIMALVGVGILVGIPLAAAYFLPGERWLGLLGLIPLAAAIVCWRLIELNRTSTAAKTFAAAAVVFCTALFGFAAVRVATHQHSDVLLSAIQTNSDGPEIASFACHEPSWVFYARQPVLLFTGHEPRKASEFLADSSDAFLITTERSYQRLKPLLPGDVEILAKERYFLKRDENLLVIGRSSAAHVADAPSTAGPIRR